MYETMGQCLQAMKNFCVTLWVRRLAITRIGCGLDGLAWGLVHCSILEIFNEVDIEIVLYHLVDPILEVPDSPTTRITY